MMLVWLRLACVVSSAGGLILALGVGVEKEITLNGNEKESIGLRQIRPFPATAQVLRRRTTH